MCMLCTLLALSALSCKHHEGESRDIDTGIIDIPYSAEGNLDSPQPAITFDVLEVNAGRILQGDVKDFTFEFQNTGKAPMVISDISASCGCTVAKEYPRGKIMPGERGNIQVSYDSENKWGDQVSVVAVTTNTPTPRTELVIRAHVVAPNMPENTTEESN